LQLKDQFKTAVPVRWSDFGRTSPVVLPILPGGGLLNPATASPNGHLFLVEPDVSHDGHVDVVDGQGHIVRRLDPEPLYFWATDSQSLCVLHQAGGQIDDMRLGVIGLPTGDERDFYRFHPEKGVALHGIVACSPDHNRVVVQAMIANGSQPSTTFGFASAPTVATLVALSFSGGLIARYDVARSGDASYVITSRDGGVFAENPIDPARPALIRDMATGRSVATLNGRHVRGFDGQGTTAITVPTPSAPGREDGPVNIQLLALNSGRVLWARSGYFCGSLAWLGHERLVVGVGEQPMTTQSGYDLVGLDTQGHAVLVAQNAFFG
jgi:hypothetical protein